MVVEHNEEVESDFKGTIIDLETIGSFIPGTGSEQYKKIIPVIFGFINKEGLKIKCAKNHDSIPKLRKESEDILESLDRPFYAFNSLFERGVLFNQLGREIKFEGELNKFTFESKKSVVESLNIPNYDDPFNDKGLLCMHAWMNGEIKRAMLHNRSCLLKEKDILLRRGFRMPDELKLIK